MNSYFVINDLAQDSIDELNGIPFAGTSANVIASQWGCQWWIESNLNGEDVLCTNIRLGTPCYLTLNTSGTPYTVHAKPFVPVPVCEDNTSSIFGPTPGVLFKPGPKK